ncbi:MAG: peptidylprolyl isomerase [Treponema sp.]|nr:peptidylprolyl isomerase [Treponema sp.]
MIIEKNKMVKIHYTLKDSEGTVIDASKENEPLEYLHGVGILIPGLERQLEGKSAGEKIHAEVEPAEGYGEYDENLVSDVSRSQFDANIPIEIGQTFQADTPSGPFLVHVTNVTDDTITVDGNHELAGKKLFFDVNIVDIRDATADELEPFEYSGGGCGGGGCASCGGCGGGGCGDGCGCN